MGEVTITVSLKPVKGSRLAVLVAIPGQPDGSLALVLSGDPDADFGGVLDTVALVPDDGSPRPVREPDPEGTRDLANDARGEAAMRAARAFLQPVLWQSQAPSVHRTAGSIGSLEQR